MGDFLRCKNCKHDKGKCVGSSRKGGHKNCFEPKIATNADNIRAMNNYELSVFLAKTKAMVYRADLPVIAYSTQDVAENLEWLQQPAED